MELKNVKRYTPEEQKFGKDVMYYIDESGLDFYDSANKFTKKYKCCIEPDTRIVRSVSEDVSHLYPVGFDIVETAVLPEGFDIRGGWVFARGKVVARQVGGDELIFQAESEKTKRLADASAAIATLADAVELEIATDEEAARLTEWKKYRVLLSRVDANNASQITWPELPA
ncbi:tail fiber assembly protein [Cedecea davisae]|uniref:Tail fiber assembly protein n=1 Tax=Cedecea davisae TaxID=158484 RepID=A0ABS6DC91_9ENTR|nr:tail fiber assembly protein [Cedecea davisae]MBU4680446.1 tail fiber assembly protein [Cedecea davisae]MBU4684938.1 tail fiber assembly protein [Cedecea davisae]